MCYTAAAQNFMENDHSSRVVRFGFYEADLRSRELRKRGLKLKVQEKPFAVLAVLLENPGELVTREELRQKLWPSDTFVDFDHGLSIATHKLRQVLCDSADNPRFIETLPGRGYRFIAPVEKSWSTHLSDRPVIAVLPFSNFSDDPQQEFFVDGLTEEMIAQLGRINPHRLRVIARTSSAQYKRTTKTLPQIAEELKANYILEGSVRRDNHKVRITAQLIDAGDQTQLWANAYDRSVEDVLSIQEDVARSIAESLAVELLPEQQALIARSATRNSEAHDLYLYGRHYWNLRTEEGFRKAVEYFRKAIAKDPNYPLPYAGLADCYNMFGFFGVIPPKDAFPNAKAAATTALKLDGNLAEAHCSLAYSVLRYEWDWPTAERHHTLAIELNPNYGAARDWYGMGLMEIGRLDDALVEMQRALQYDPLSLVIGCHLGWAFYFARRYGRAIETMERFLELDPNYSLMLYFVGMAYEQAGRYQEAIDRIGKAVELTGGHPGGIAALAHTYWLWGKRDEARRQLKLLESAAQKRYTHPYFFAFAYAGMEEIEKSFEWLQKSFDERSNWLIHLELEPAFDALHGDPRFTALVKKVDPCRRTSAAAGV